MTSALEHVNGAAPSHAESWAKASVHEAEARAILMQAESDRDAARIAAEAEAQAVIIKAGEEAERQRLANERAALRNKREAIVEEGRIAEAQRALAATNRLAAAEARDAADAEAAEEAETEAREDAAQSWRRSAIAFAVICALVALPVQMSAFYRADRPYLAGVPIVLEAGAWVVLKGAAAAVTDRRPHWHYRLIAWCIAAGAATVNLAHGLTQFDIVTAIATAVASLAGPGVWDLHEHGRIRARDGVLSWRERRAQDKAAAAAADEKAALAAKAEADKRAADEAAKQAAEQLAAERENEFPDVWKHARRLAAALGETTVTDAIWKRAHRDIEGTDPGESVDIIRGRNAAERRLRAARSEAPGEKPIKVTSAQRAIQIKTPSRRSTYRPVPPRRTKGDTPPYHPAARAAIGETKRNATNREGETA